MNQTTTGKGWIADWKHGLRAWGLHLGRVGLAGVRWTGIGASLLGAMTLLAVDPPPAGSGNPPLWALEKDGARVYLLGSVHILRDQDHPFPALLDEAFAKSDRVMLEADVDESKSPEKQTELAMRAIYLDGTGLPDHLSAATYALLRKYATESGLQVPDYYRPWLVSSLITLEETGKAGLREDLGVDVFYYTKAKQAGKPVLFLETVDFQFDLLAGASDAVQVRSLESTLDRVPTLATDSVALAAQWRAGDVAAIRESTWQEEVEDPAEFERLVTSRSRTWISQIETLLTEPKTTLLIVGTAHLVGENGVVNLLRNRGHTVQRLPASLEPDPAGRFVGWESDPGGRLGFSVELSPERSYAVEARDESGTWRTFQTFFATNRLMRLAPVTPKVGASEVLRLRTPPAR